jgi:hypothetical protein
MRAEGRELEEAGAAQAPRLLDPAPVSVIAHVPAELGRAASELRFSRIAGDNRRPQRIVIPRG